MPPVGPRAIDFINNYSKGQPARHARADLLETIVKDWLELGGFDIHGVESRAKSVDSVRLKVLRKGYGNPGMQLTDKIGTRIITHFEPDVDRVAKYVRDYLDLDEKRSIDKRISLGLTEFGYRSLHFVGTIRDDRIRMGYERLKGVRFELQIRSILEHAWAEIEHDAVYKSGLKLPDSMTRQLSAIAGTLEILDHQFERLRAQRGELISKYEDEYLAGDGLDETLDSARLIANLNAQFPRGIGWLESERTGKPFPPGIESTCVYALSAVGVKSPRQLQLATRSKRFKSIAQRFAASRGLDSAGLTHLVVAVIAILASDAAVARLYFPEMAAEIER